MDLLLVFKRIKNLPAPGEYLSAHFTHDNAAKAKLLENQKSLMKMAKMFWLQVI